MNIRSLVSKLWSSSDKFEMKLQISKCSFPKLHNTNPEHAVLPEHSEHTTIQAVKIFLDKKKRCIVSIFFLST